MLQQGQAVLHDFAGWMKQHRRLCSPRRCSAAIRASLATFWSSTRTSVRIPTRSMQYPGKLSGRKLSGFPVRSPRLCRTRLKIPIPSSAGKTNQNMTRSSHRKWGQAINACPHFAKSYGIVGAIFAEYLGSVSAAASENPSLLFY